MPACPPPPRHPQIPAHKVKLVVGAGGEKIKFIQKKTKCRIQVGAGGWLLRCCIVACSCHLLGQR